MTTIKYTNKVHLVRVKADKVDMDLPYVAFENNEKEMEYYLVSVDYGV